MRRVVLGLAVAAGVQPVIRRALIVAAVAAATAAAPAQAYEAPGPCERQRELFEKYNIELGMHSEELEYAYSTACGVTG
jgi:hypothetical protein